MTQYIFSRTQNQLFSKQEFPADAIEISEKSAQMIHDAQSAGLPFELLSDKTVTVAPSAAHKYYSDKKRWIAYTFKYSPSSGSFYPTELLESYKDLPDDIIDVTADVHQKVIDARSSGLAYFVVDGETVQIANSPVEVWSSNDKAFIVDQKKQAELDKQAAQAAGAQKLAAIEQAIQSHINATVQGLGMGFTDDQSLIGKYAGYDNVFRPIAEAVGKWVAGIWCSASQDKAEIIAGKKGIPTIGEALAQIPPFVPPTAEATSGN